MRFKNLLLTLILSATTQYVLADQSAQEIAKMCLVENDERLAAQTEEISQQFQRCMQEEQEPVACRARRDEFLKYFNKLHKEVRDSWFATAEGKLALRELANTAL